MGERNELCVGFQFCGQGNGDHDLVEVVWSCFAAQSGCCASGQLSFLQPAA